MEVDDGRINSAFCEYSRYLCRTVALHTEFENLSYDFRALLVYYPFFLIFGVFLVAERRHISYMFSCVSFGAYYGFDFLTAIFGVHLVQDIFERRNIVVGVGFAVHLVVDCYKPNVRFGKIVFRVVAYKNMVSAEGWFCVVTVRFPFS